MISEAGRLIDRLNSPADWAIVLGAGTLGFVLDGAINIAPLPFFSPGTCGLAAASGAFAIKRGFDAWTSDRTARRRLRLLVGAVERAIQRLRDGHRDEEAEDLLLELELSRDDPEALVALVRQHRPARSVFANMIGRTPDLARAAALASLARREGWYGGEEGR